MGNLNTNIAKLYLIDQFPQIDIAVELGLDRSTISRRIPMILERVEQTAKRLEMTR